MGHAVKKTISKGNYSSQCLKRINHPQISEIWWFRDTRLRSTTRYPLKTVKTATLRTSMDNNCSMGLRKGDPPTVRLDVNSNSNHREQYILASAVKPQLPGDLVVHAWAYMNRKLDEKWLKFKKCVFGFYYLFNKTSRGSGIDSGSQYCHQEARNFLSLCFSLWVLALLTTSWLQDDCHCTRHHTYAQWKRWKLVQHGSCLSSLFKWVKATPEYPIRHLLIFHCPELCF